MTPASAALSVDCGTTLVVMELSIEVKHACALEPRAALVFVLGAHQSALFPSTWPVPGVVGQEGDDFRHGSIGHAERTLLLSDGTSSRERLLHRGPDSFSYEGSGFTGVFRFLVARTASTWSVQAAGGGSEVTWRYVFEPLALRTPLVRAILPSWQRSMTLGLESLLS